MKKMLVIVGLILGGVVNAQISVTLQLPQAGLMLKGQLWNMVLSNNTGSDAWIHVELTLTDAGTGNQVMGATTGTVSVAPGNQLLQVNSFSPIQYTLFDPAYQAFLSGDFLPVGQFMVCYNVIQHRGDAVERVSEECDYIDVEPLSPPQLIYPYNQTAIEMAEPIFTWLPPAPSALFTNMTYELEIVEMLPGQTESDAIQQNIPFYTVSNLISPVHPYPGGAPELEMDKKYAWRVSVKNSNSVIAVTETWWFNYKIYGSRDRSSQNGLPFSKLRRDNQPSFALALNDLKFDYVNETEDSVWNIRVVDISTAQSHEVDLPMDSIPLQRGQNFISISLGDLPGYVDKHLYLLEVANSRNEVWRLKFEYLKKDDDQD